MNVVSSTPRDGSRLVWCVLALCVLWNALLVGRYGANIPRADEWRDIRIIIGDESPGVSSLWSPHDVHRIPLPRLARLALYRVSGDFRSTLVANVLLMVAATLAVLGAARRLRGETSRLDAFFPLLLLGPGHFMNFLWGFQMQFVLSVALFLAAIALVVTMDGRPTPRRLAVLGLCTAANILTGMNGVAFALPMMVWLLAALVFGRNGRFPALAACALASAGVLLALYPVGLSTQGRTVSPVGAARTALEFLATSLGSSVPSWWLRAGFVVALTGASAVTLTRVFRSSADERWRASGLFCGLSSMLLLAGLVGLGREGFTVNAGLQPRYTTIAVPILCIVYFVFLLYGGEASRRRVHAALLVATLLALPMSLYRAVGYGKQRREQMEQLAGDVARGLPLFAIAARNGMAVYPYAPGVSVYLDLLRERRAWPFTSYAPSPEVRTEVAARVPVDLERLVLNDLKRLGASFVPTGPAPQLVFRLDSPRPVAGVELDYSLAASPGRFTRLEVHWDVARGGAPDFPSHTRRAAFPMDPRKPRDRLSATIYADADAFRIDVDAAASSMEIHEIVVLELAPDWMPR